MCVSIFLGLTVYGYLTEGKEKGEIRKAFQYYLSKNVVDQVLTDPQQLQLGGKKGQLHRPLFGYSRLYHHQ